MKNVSNIAFESYKEDLRRYDNSLYKIKFSNYDWKLSIAAYNIMLENLTSYKNMYQPQEDYDAFGVENNSEVIDIVDSFIFYNDIYQTNNDEYIVLKKH
ncbi:hypothetical protein [Apilactobacillus bombintestini]|uniref:Uncharacterized protein n=1 Tax=Apilactobacillus bombintestini TaxID=2419772 RepID=A0A387AUR4_9LACO|nr:hypothetical protein [Apilactobacillus bombintestini]AYF93079.1 hypothetical protein D7I45_06185 [Apilactobacillus bombintestini]